MCILYFGAVVINVAKERTLTCPEAQSTALLQDTPPAACTHTCHPEMFETI